MTYKDQCLAIALFLCSARWEDLAVPRILTILIREMSIFLEPNKSYIKPVPVETGKTLNTNESLNKPYGCPR